MAHGQPQKGPAGTEVVAALRNPFLCPVLVHWAGTRPLGTHFSHTIR